MATVLAVEELSKCYGQKKAVDNISFTVHRGEVLTFGPERRRKPPPSA